MGAEYRAKCTNCAGVESPGFYTGCMQKDEGKPINGWTCDGEGNLTRAGLWCDLCGRKHLGGVLGEPCGYGGCKGAICLGPSHRQGGEK